jgi:hypothetical protein
MRYSNDSHAVLKTRQDITQITMIHTKLLGASALRLLVFIELGALPFIKEIFTKVVSR